MESDIGYLKDGQALALAFLNVKSAQIGPSVVHVSDSERALFHQAVNHGGDRG